MSSRLAIQSPADVKQGRVEIAVAVVEHDGHYLIGERPEGAALAGCWEFPGGKVRPDETPAEAAARECLEETGLEVRVMREFPTVDHDYEHARVRLHFFACAAIGHRAPLPERFRWEEASALSAFRFPPANDAILKRIAGVDQMDSAV